MTARAPLRLVRRLLGILVVCVASWFFLIPGSTVVSDLRDPAIGGPGTPRAAWRLHRALTPRFEQWARERVASGAAATAPLHDVPTTEWPLFSAVFYLMATEALEGAFQAGDHANGEPKQYAAAAIHAAKDLLVDPTHHTWVRTHWGDGYMHRENVFFRALLIAGLSSYEALTRDGTELALLRDQTDTLANDLDASPRGLLNDYPHECYPIDVLAAIGFIQRADRVLGTDHGVFIARSRRAFEGQMADPLGLVPYRVSTETYEEEQPSRGVGNSWVALFAGDLWPDLGRDLYSRYERSFWQDHGWAAGFREYAPRGRGGGGGGEGEWTQEVDAGAVIDGFGTAASAFGIAGARRSGRFDHAYTLTTEMLAMSWPLPNGTWLGPRAVSHATDAPYLGEAGLLYFVTVEARPGAAAVRGGRLTGLVYGALALYFGLGCLLLVTGARLVFWRPSPRNKPERSPATAAAGLRALPG